MKKIVSVFVLSALLSNIAGAQVQPTVSIVDTKDGLNPKSVMSPVLTDEQNVRVEEINKYYNNLNASLTESAGYSLEAIREKKQSLEMERLEKLRQVLSPEQFNSLMAAAKLASLDPKFFSKEIGLSDDQINGIAEINSSLAEKENKVKGDYSMSVDERQKALSFIQSERLENLNRILTPDQMKKIASLSSVNAAPSAAPVKKASTVTPAKKSATAGKPAKKS